MLSIPLKLAPKQPPTTTSKLVPEKRQLSNSDLLILTPILLLAKSLRTHSFKDKKKPMNFMTRLPQILMKISATYSVKPLRDYCGLNSFMPTMFALGCKAIAPNPHHQLSV